MKVQLLTIASILAIVSVSTSSMAISADAMKVPFWYEYDPVTDQMVYIDHFNTMKYVDIPQETKTQMSYDSHGYDMPEIPEREGYVGEIVMVERTVKYTEYTTVGSSGADLGLFQNPGFPVKHTVTKTVQEPTIKWTPIESESVVVEVVEVVEATPTLIEPVLSVVEPVIEPVVEPVLDPVEPILSIPSIPSPPLDNECIFTYVIANECAALNDYSPHELKQMKLDHEKTKANEVMASLFPGLY